jgi:HPt (histidine-containing phosphotransfer) domain-containing protein
MPTRSYRKPSLIDIERVNAIGGLDSPDICRILDAFISDLGGYLPLIERLREEESTLELLATLHKLAGSARTCGFAGIDRAAALWDNSNNPYKASLYSNLRKTIETSTEEWQKMRA